MVKEIGIEAIQVGQGGVVADMKFKTEAGTVIASRMVFPLKDHEGLKAAVSMLETEIEKAIEASLGLPPIAEPEKKS